MKKAVFLDRDGTLIKDNGFLGDISKVSFYPFAAEALKILQKQFVLFIVTNQCGVANGIITPREVEKVNKFVIDTFAAEGINIKECYVCPHAIDAGCQCRKPSPFFAKQAAAEYKLDLSASCVIGDHLSDMNFASAFGGRGYYVLTGHGRHHHREVPEDIPVSRNILYAARKIIAVTNAK
jgi:D-glycero-D-manno-heptose 1,7-bisphosphate phosphatase